MQRKRKNKKKIQRKYQEKKKSKKKKQRKNEIPLEKRAPAIKTAITSTEASHFKRRAKKKRAFYALLVT